MLWLFVFAVLFVSAHASSVVLFLCLRVCSLARVHPGATEDRTHRRQRNKREQSPEETEEKRKPKGCKQRPQGKGTDRQTRKGKKREKTGRGRRKRSGGTKDHQEQKARTQTNEKPTAEHLFWFKHDWASRGLKQTFWLLAPPKLHRCCLSKNNPKEAKKQKPKEHRTSKGTYSTEEKSPDTLVQWIRHL